MSYNIFSCLCCLSKNVEYKSARLSRFTQWRISGVDPSDDVSNQLVSCKDCTFNASSVRLTSEEELKLYYKYRQEEYNNLRIICDPSYSSKSLVFDHYYQDRKNMIKEIIQKNLTEQEIESVKSILDYGGEDGKYIPEMFNGAEKFVFDISNVDLIENVHSYDMQSRNPVDFLMCCQVIEHKSNLDEIMNDLVSLSKKWIYLEVPFYQNPPPENINIVEHLNFFNEKSLTMLCNRFGIINSETFVNLKLGILGIIGKIKKE